MGDGNIAGTESCSRSDVMGTVVGIVKGKRTVVPGKARIWRLLKPVRRYLLGIYRRIAI
jgi:hypothetical protein